MPGCHSGEGLAVIRIFGAANAVPPGEIEPEISRFGAVVQIVMGVGRLNAENGMGRGAARKQFEPAMADHIAQDHVNHEKINDRDMEWQHKN